MTLRYPKEIGGLAGSDYVTFTPQPYRANKVGRQDAVAPSPGQAIVLYMPNSTPPVANANDWGDVKFPGPLGAFTRDVGVGITRGIQGLNSGRSVDDIVEDVTGQFEANTPEFGGVAKQAALSAVSKQVSGASAQQMLALSRGEVYNPNVELLYSSPKVRPFSFTFDFVPKDAGETEMMNQIIMSFKKWSSPKDLQNGMFEVPYIWQVRYMIGQGDNQYMNRFKKAACTNVSVQANSSTDMHVSHADGAPIITTMQLQFMEVDIITRQDHMSVGGQGY